MAVRERRQAEMEVSSGLKRNGLLIDPTEEVRQSKWIDYPVATEALDRLERIFKHPETHRPPCCLLVGDTNNGKTSIAVHFARRRNRNADVLPEPIGRRRPVIYLQAPPGPDLGELYGGILRSVAAPYSQSWRWPRKQAQILDLLPTLGVRMIVIDEIHNINQGTHDQQALFLNGLKFLTNELRIPIVAVGTRNAETVFQADQQMGNRFEPLRIPKWNPDEEYATFAIRVILSAGFHAGTDFKSKRFIQRIHALSDGLTGETVKLLHQAIDCAIQDGEKIINAEHINHIEWTPPKERRAKAR